MHTGLHHYAKLCIRLRYVAVQYVVKIKSETKFQT